MAALHANAVMHDLNSHLIRYLGCKHHFRSCKVLTDGSAVGVALAGMLSLVGMSTVAQSLSSAFEAGTDIVEGSSNKFCRSIETVEAAKLL